MLTIDFRKDNFCKTCGSKDKIEVTKNKQVMTEGRVKA